MTAAPGRHDFPVESSEDAYDGRVMALRTDRVVMPGGRVAVREVVEHSGAVAIAALDADDRVMMIHQYRHAVRRRLWELPAGLLDVAGEDPLATAERELTEEAGLTATEWAVLVDIVPLGVAVGRGADGVLRRDRQRDHGGGRARRARNGHRVLRHPARDRRST